MTNPSPKPRLRNRAKALVCYRQTNNVPGGGAMSISNVKHEGQA